MQQCSIAQLLILIFCSGFVLPGCSTVKTLAVHHGVMAADVSDTSVLIWSRANRAAKMHLQLIPDHGVGEQQVIVQARDDFTGVIPVQGLNAKTRYEYRVWFSEIELNGVEDSPVVRGHFQTAAKPMDAAAFSLTWAGDFAGQNVCRDAQEGFPIFSAIEQEHANLFIGLGDMIYADSTCESVGRYGNQQVVGHFSQAANLNDFWAHWRYTRADKGLQSLTANTAYFGLWDDHEVVNDFGPLTDRRAEPPYVSDQSLMPIGMKAFLDYSPMRSLSSDDNQMYRTVRYGKHAQIIFLDTRQYRDANGAPDSEHLPKTMLGQQQLTWLTHLISTSDATWKIIVSSVPMSIPTGYPAHAGRDGWADFEPLVDPLNTQQAPKITGFEQELRHIMKLLHQANSNSVFITTDVHFAEVFRYTPFHPDREFVVHEIATGPGNAGIFPDRRFDTTLGAESLFFYGPQTAEAVQTWEQAKAWFNYGLIEIDEEGVLTTAVKNIKGQALYTLTLHPK